MEDLHKVITILTKLMGSIAPSQSIVRAAAAAAVTPGMMAIGDIDVVDSDVTSNPPTPTQPVLESSNNRSTVKRKQQVASITTQLEKCALNHFIKINYTAPVRFSLLDHAFIAWCFCHAYTCPTPIPEDFQGEDVRATFEIIHEWLEPFQPPRFPDALKQKVSHMVVGLFGRVDNPVLIEAEKNPWQPPLLPASQLAQADETQRQRIHVAYSVLGVYTHSNHYIPDEDDPNARLPPIEMRQPVDAISFIAAASRLWYWTMFRQRLLSAKTIRVWREGQEDFFEAAGVRLNAVIQDNSRIEFQSQSELNVRDTCLFRLCPTGSLPTQMRIQHCVRANVLSAGSVFQGERGFNVFNRYADTLKLRYPKFQIELRERRGHPRLTKDGEEVVPPGTSSNMSIDEIEMINTSWVMAIIHRWIAQNTRWSHKDVVKSLEFTPQFIILEHELSTRANVLLSPRRDAETRRPLIIEIQHKFYVHYFPSMKRYVAYNDNHYIIVPDPAHPDPILVECNSFEEAFCKWCYVMREFYDGLIEQRLTMKLYIDTVLPDTETF